MTNEARYDAIAAWYPGWVGDGSGLIAEGVGGLLPSSLRGARVLDVAFGHGRASCGLARLGVVPRQVVQAAAGRRVAGAW